MEVDGIHLELGEARILLTHISAQSSLVEWLKVVQGRDPKLSKPMEEVRNGKHLDFALDSGGALDYGNCLCVLDCTGLREVILEKAHSSKYLVHPSFVKMYQDLK